jgi:hypothetical protein
MAYLGAGPTLFLLGAYHGINPGMGWLFAVALGMQERSAQAVLRALAPIALGHALAIGVVVAAVWSLGLVIPQEAVMLLGGGFMLAFVAFKIVTRFRHPAWVGMRVTGSDLVAWSFLMATAHGAGLMLVPALLRFQVDGVPSADAHAEHHAHHAEHIAAAGDGLATSLLAVGVHTAGMLVVSGALALVVFHKVGVEVLRKAWINVDLIWIGTMGVTGSLTLGLALWNLMA